jgi:polysaccharide biosynthesis protein VpsQ
MSKSVKNSPAQRHRLPLGLLSLVYLALFLTILLLAYTDRLPAYLGQIPYYDKVGHVGLYAVAAYLGHRVLGYRGWGQLPLFPSLFGIFTLAEELIQGLSPHRTLDATDLIASFAGLILGWQIAERSRDRAEH